jgi:alkylation response protein AidB-like acyl-CoA dehydrogenase
MNFDLDENQSLFKATVERFAASADVPARHKTRKQPGGFNRERWREMAELGLIAIAGREADGGLSGTLLDCAIVAQALGKAQAVEPWLECGFLGSRLLSGTPYAADVISGETLAAFAFAEPNRRFALDAVAVQARAARDGYVLSGEKHFVLSGAVADLFIVTARLGDETTLFVVPHDAKGVDAKPYPVADGSFATVLMLRDVHVGAPLSDSSARLAQAVADARVMASAEMVGIAQRLFDDTLNYVKTREQFGQPLGRFQVIQHRMVDGYTKVEQMQSALYRHLLQNGDVQGLKAFIGESALWVAHQAVQLHGGMGMTDELGIGHGLKRIMLLSKLFGDPASDLATYAKAA